MDPRHHHDESELRELGLRLKRLVPAIYSSNHPRPLVDGSVFRFDSTGCIARPREVFDAMMDGVLTRKEMEAICLHKMVCWKCNETLAAFRLQYEQRARRMAQRLKNMGGMLPSDSEDDFGCFTNPLRTHGSDRHDRPLALPADNNRCGKDRDCECGRVMVSAMGSSDRGNATHAPT